MQAAKEIPQLNDCFLVNLDIENCPMAEIPLVDLFDMVTSTLLDNYRETLHETIVQMLEDTMWIDPPMMETFVGANFGMFEVRENGLIISLRTSSLQRLVTQSVANRATPIVAIQIPIMIRFKLTTAVLPSPSKPVAIISANVGGDPPTEIRSGPPSNVSETELLDQVSELPISSPVIQQQTRNVTIADVVNPNVGTTAPRGNVRPETMTPRDEPSSVPGTSTNFRDDYVAPVSDAGTTFRGKSVDVSRPQGYGPSTGATSRRDYDSTEGPTHGYVNPPHRGLLTFDNTVERTPGLTRTPSKAHPYSEEVTFGAETFEDYMSQFHYSEVKFKDFRKVTIPKFDSSKNDSFVHWYKLFVSTCLQWGIWCPPYESIQEDKVHGAWWVLLPQSVRNQESFMAHLIYSVLVRPDTFPANSREIEAVEGSSANMGYNAIYNLLRLHHPVLHSVFSTANEIPRHRRNESFSLYLRRLQEFIVRERLATRTYTESEALDLAVRNLSAEWRNEFRRLVERDKRSGNGGTLPFKLALPQMATTFVEYALEIGRDPPGSGHSTASRSAPTSIMRRLETTHEDEGDDPSAFLPDADVDLIVRAIAQNQESSAVCLGCQLPGHTLVECNRFVDYIVAESLAQRNPTLRNQVANSHSHFRNRLNAATARSRLASSTVRPTNTSRTMRSLQVTQPSSEADDSALDTPVEPASTFANTDDPADGYRQHAIQLVDDDSDDDFETCFDPVTICSVVLLGIDDSCPVSVDTVLLPPEEPTSDPIVLRRLAETYDVAASASYAHADNGSMANTVDNSELLFAYRPLKGSTVRLLDAGNHAHHPLGVGFLCVPTTDRGIAGAPTSVYIRTYHTPTIPGIIISHSAMSKQLRTSSYHTSSHVDEAGFIHFPHRARRCQDIYITIQPTSKRGGLTFTDALMLPTIEQHKALLSPSMRVFRLCSDHQQDSSAAIADPTDGMFCQACQTPPLSDFR